MGKMTSLSLAEATEIATTIIALEKAALEKWNKGDPSAYINLSADDVVYFDPFIEERLDGLEALRRYYEPFIGEVHVHRCDMIAPKVQATKYMVTLTFNLYSYEGNHIYKWNCTEVYRFEENGQWKIIQTHWSFIKPDLNNK
ncbi:nuclear transport factor 2 family protein [Chitinophaga sp.]|uniref:YybH family protein n=1 Tax=Chitinophaga sp. TaxID=1869181 RepID=UPI0031DA1C6B